jgi:hypothetical protein
MGLEVFPNSEFHGYDVGLPIFNAGVGNIINATISNVGNDNSARKDSCK